MQSTFNYLNPDDFARAIATIPQLGIRKWLDKDVEMLFKICYWCGLRPSEGIRLKKEDFNLGEREVSLGQTKTAKQDKAPIPARFIPELQAYLDIKEPGSLLPDLTYDTAYVWFKRLGRLLGIIAWTKPQSETGEKTVGHIFRKSLGKDMSRGTYGKKFSPAIVSKQLRHSKPSITIDHYLKETIEAVKEEW